MFSWFSLPDFSIAFTSIILQSVPFLLLGSLLSACLDQFIPDAVLGRWLRVSSSRGILLACVAGFFLPVCECGAMPVVRRLILKGVPVAAASAYYFSSSILNPLCLLSTWLAFRTRNPGSPLWMVTWRMIGGVLLVLLLSWLIRRWKSGSALDPNFAQSIDKPTAEALAQRGQPTGGVLAQRWHRFAEAVTHDFLGVIFYVIGGAFLAAFFNTTVNRAWLQPWLDAPAWAPLLTILMAQVLCLCSTTDAFIIAAFPQMPAHAALAFLVAGPLFDWRLFWVYRTLFRWPVVVAIAIATTGGAYILSLCVFYLRL